MIQKSFIVENNVKLLKNKFSLFYGENVGLINEFKSKICKIYNNEIIKFNQRDILDNQNILISEINNFSLFENKKVFFLLDVNDKIFNIIEKIILKNNENQFFYFQKN